jgi:hypothetical protein
VMWKALTTMSVTSGTLTVNLSNQANGFVVADGVYLVHNDLPSAPLNLGNSSTSGGSTSITASKTGHKAAMPLDVSGDGQISALDALLLVDYLRAPSPDKTASAFMDVNGDGTISPLDLLEVVDYLIAPTSSAQAVRPAVPKPTAQMLVAAPAGSTAGVVPAASIAAAPSATAVDQAISQMTAAPLSLGTPNVSATSTPKIAPPIVYSNPVKKTTAANQSNSLLDSDV